MNHLDATRVRARRRRRPARPEPVPVRVGVGVAWRGEARQAGRRAGGGERADGRARPLFLKLTN